MGLLQEMAKLVGPIYVLTTFAVCALSFYWGFRLGSYWHDEDVEMKLPRIDLKKKKSPPKPFYPGRSKDEQPTNSE